MPNDQVKGPQAKGPKPTAEAKQTGSEDIETYLYNSNSSMGIPGRCNHFPTAYSHRCTASIGCAIFLRQ